MKFVPCRTKHFFHSKPKNRMRQKSIINCLLALGTATVILACNQQEKKEDAVATTDTTAKETTASVEQPAQETTMDAVKVAPNLYKVLKDTMGIRVLEILYNAGDSSALHSHPDNVLYVISGGKAEFTEKDGTKLVNEVKSGSTMIQPASTHSVKNVGTTTVKAVLVEVNRPNNTGVAKDATLDALKVAPTLYKNVKDTMNLRVLTTTYKAGASSALHAHPDHVAYVIEGGTAEMTAKDGTKNVNTLPSGSALVVPASAHSVKNTGKTTLKVLLVEVNRPAQ